MEDREATRARLLDKANSLPLRPGVYIMKNNAGTVIYVGKSAKLKNRVSQYFQNSKKNIKTEKMVGAVHDFDFYLCDTEMEALTLENVLIKEYNPRYNILLKDAKSYPYIKVTTGEEYPRLVMTRTRAADRAKYFGPYSGAGIVYNIIDTLEKSLGIPGCKRQFPADIGKGRPCIYYQIGQCMGTCRKGSSKEDYDAAIGAALRVLGGDFDLAKDELTARMYRLAEHENFEAAAKCRDSIAALDKISERQKVVSSPKADQDVVALYSDGLVDSGHDVGSAHGDNAAHLLAAKDLDQALAAHNERRRVDNRAGALAYVVDKAAAAADQHHLRHGPAPQSRAKRSPYRHLARPDAR